MNEVTRTCTIYWPSCTGERFATRFTVEWRASYFFPHDGVPYSREVGVEVAEKLTRLQEEVASQVSKEPGANDVATYGVPSVCSLDSTGVRVGDVRQGVQFWVAGAFEYRDASFIRDIVRDLYSRAGFDIVS